MEKKTVVVGMSGGIDSSVAALLLQQQGYEVIGVTLKHLPDELSENPGKTCCSLDDINDARYTCYNLGIPHYVINVTDEFKKEVRENGENENEVLSALLREYLEDLRDAKELDKAIEESDGKFYSLNDVIKELGFENELL